MDVLEEGDGELAQHCSHAKTKLGDMLVFIMAFKSKWVGLTKLLMVVLVMVLVMVLVLTWPRESL